MSFAIRERFVPEPKHISRLLSAINLQGAWGRQDYLLILWICHTGLRICETTSLTIDHVAFVGEPRDAAFVPTSITKGEKRKRRSRSVYLNKVAKKCVRKLLEFNKARGFSTEPEAPLFPWKNHDFLPIREAERRFQRLRESVGLPHQLKLHTLRHFFASRLVWAGVDLATVQSLLGHKDNRSTQIYTHTTEARRRAAVARLVGERGVL